MTCQEFLARHSEYVDELMAPLAAALWRDHAASCPGCARYDRVVRRGLGLVQDLQPIEPSPEFYPRLQYRLFRLEEAARAGNRASGAGAVLAMAVAGVLALIAWSPLLRSELGGTVQRAAGDGRPAAERAAPPEADGRWVQLAAEADRVHEGVVLTSAPPEPEWWWSAAPPTPAFRQVHPAALVIPGPYSPLVVGAPAVRPASVLRRIDPYASRE